MTTTETTGAVMFQGIGVGTEIWGATQANFLVSLPPGHAKEVAILLNDPAAKQLASEVGAEDGDDFRALAAQAAGEAYLQDRLTNGHPIEAVSYISHALLATRPDLIAAVQAALGK
ncbi:MAG TPA: hypothetical protein PKI89_07810 [Tepidiformaceae bacterium]|nr:hypothetical protein [Tepidiformaceae bacterium]